MHNRSPFRKDPEPCSSGSLRPFATALIIGIACLLQAGAAFGAEAAAGQMSMKPVPVRQIVLFFFLMLGPFKIIGPFAAMTRGADAGFARRLAFRAILFSGFALLLAALVGEGILTRYDIPLPVLALAGGIILFLVALQAILQQFAPQRNEGEVAPPTLKMAISPLAFPTIVTPYGIAALIVFITLSPDIGGKVIIFAILLGIMLLNLAVMLSARHILRFLGVFLQILGAILGIIQVALGLKIIINALKQAWG